MNKVNNIQGLSYVNPEGIVPFENNPFEVRDDEEMKSLIESIKEYTTSDYFSAERYFHGGVGDSYFQSPNFFLLA